MNLNKAWDKSAEHFNTYKQEIWYGAADNIHSSWPVVIKYISEHFPNLKGMRALDFGCGTGMFCRELQNLGFRAIGVDMSEEMIKIGNAHLKRKVKLITGDTFVAKELANQEGKFDLISSIMVLQFIEESLLKPLFESVQNGGHIIFVNHNPNRLQEQGISDTLCLVDQDIPMPIYPRSAYDYDQVLLKLGFKKTLEQLVEHSEDFIKKYKIKRTTKHPKYMILGYEKTN